MSLLFRRTPAALAVALAASCATIDQPIPLPEGRWELTTSSFIDGGRMPGLPRATLEMGKGRISAFSGCNSGSGSVESVDGRMTVSPLATTRRACPEPLGAFEGRYFKLLAGRPYFRLEGEQLILSAGDDSARFRRAPVTTENK
ncbi:MAG: META domain-containing protein [Burkholderiales bacterium]|nr:META domain-containing protein [Burkholderiales bacterium]